MKAPKALLVLLLLTPAVADAQVRQPRFSIDQVLSAAFPYGIVAARTTDRIVWIENERGMRNVYTAAAPAFTPVRLTATTLAGKEPTVLLAFEDISAQKRAETSLRRADDEPTTFSARS